MENRDRDRVSQRNSGTEAGEQNRQTEESRGREKNSGTSAEFGQNIGRSEHLTEGEDMRDRNKEGMQDDQSSMNNENESSRRPDSGGFGSATGRTGSFGNRGGGGSDVSRDELDRSQGSSIDRESDPSSNRNEGRH